MDLPRAPGLALVTGASTGIGRELARLLASDGYALVVAAEEPEIERVATELGAGGTVVVPAQLDLTRPGAVEELAALATGQPEPLTLVALNAGIGASGAIERSRSRTTCGWSTSTCAPRCTSPSSRSPA